MECELNGGRNENEEVKGKGGGSEWSLYNEQMPTERDRHTDRRTDEQTERRNNEQTDEHTDRRRK